jgi:hypothetical protein
VDIDILRFLKCVSMLVCVRFEAFFQLCGVIKYSELVLVDYVDNWRDLQDHTSFETSRGVEW